MRRAVLLLLLVACGFWLASCKVGPKYKRPTAPLPAAFKEPPPDSYKEAGFWNEAEPQDAAIKGKWWEVFQDPILNNLEEKVDISNQTVADAEARFRGARAAITVAKAGLYPTVSINPSVTTAHAGMSTTSNRIGLGGGGTLTIYEIPVDFAYEADVWGRVRSGVDSNVATAQASSADVETARLSAQAELAFDYFQLRGLDEQVRLFETTIVDFQRALDLTVKRHNQGIASGVDVAQAETQLESARAQAIDLAVLRAQSEHAIAILIGEPPADLTIVRKPTTLEPPVIAIGLPSELLQRRPDVAGAERRMAAANSQIGVAKAAQYPSITFNASGGFVGTTLANILSAPSRFWSLGPSLAETLYDAGALKAMTAETVAGYDSTVAVYRQSVLTALQDVEDNLASIRILAQESVQQDLATKAAQLASELALNRYRGGITSYLEVITAQQAALNNERASVIVQTRRMTSTVSLIKALGGGWDVSNVPSPARLRH
jgi:NodT family efflux transporter outer membrane factor (OMF) lipoprotein